MSRLNILRNLVFFNKHLSYQILFVYLLLFLIYLYKG
jgi:hypothetical protein